MTLPSTPSGATTRSNSYWQQAWDNALPRITEIGEELGLRSADAASLARPARVGQLDAEVLDDDLVGILKEPLGKALGLLNPGFRKYDSELVLLIRLILYKFSIWDIGASYGAKLQGLHYRSNSFHTPRIASPAGLPAQTLAAQAALTILLPYVHSRVRAHALTNAWPDTPSSDRRRKAWNILTSLESLHATAALVSFAVFLWNGRHRTIADRLLGLSLEPSRRLANREVSYEFMNRQMVWHAFTEFLLFLLPLLNSPAMRRRTNRQLARVRTSLSFSSFKRGVGMTTAGEQPLGRYAHLPADQCAICAYNATFSVAGMARDVNMHASGTEGTTSLYQPPGAAVTTGGASTSSSIPAFPITNPYATPCGHTYCYFCISEKILRAADDGEDGWECLRCTTQVKGCSRVSARSMYASDDGPSSPSYLYTDDEDNGTRSSMFESDGDMVSSFGTDLSRSLSSDRSV